MPRDLLGRSGELVLPVTTILMQVIGLIATLMLRDRAGIDLGPDNEAEQARSPLVGARR